MKCDYSATIDEVWHCEVLRLRAHLQNLTWQSAAWNVTLDQPQSGFWYYINDQPDDLNILPYLCPVSFRSCCTWILLQETGKRDNVHLLEPCWWWSSEVKWSLDLSAFPPSGTEYPTILRFCFIFFGWVLMLPCRTVEQCVLLVRKKCLNCK